MTEKTISTQEWEQKKAESFSFGDPKFHREKNTGKTDLVSHENEFDKNYLEAQYQQALKEMDKLIETGLVTKITIHEDGCEDLIGYSIGKPDFIINGHLHGDEPGPAIPAFIELVNRIKAGDKRINNVLIIPRVHDEAYQSFHRGMLLEKNLIDRLIAAKVFSEDIKKQVFVGEMLNVKKLAELLREKGFHISEDDDDNLYIDLNRQFFENELNTQPSLLLLYPKARQLMRMVRNYAPDARMGFSFHSDPSLPEVTESASGKTYSRASYLYDTPQRFPYDQDGKLREGFSAEEEELIQHCMNNFRVEMEKAGIPLFTGIDDDEDELLGKNWVEKGYTLVPSNERRKDGVEEIRTVEMHDRSFETAMTRWGMDRYWAFETAEWMNIDQRQKMTEILLDTIVLPLMSMESKSIPLAA